MRIIILLLLSINICAGTYRAIEYKFSIKAGATYSSAKLGCWIDYKLVSCNNDFISPEYRFGKTVSLSNNLRIGRFIDINLDLVYNEKRFRDIYGSDRSFHMLELPFLINFEAFKGVKLYFGGFYSTTLNDRAWSHTDNYPNDYGYLLGIKLNYRNFLIDFRFQQGVGIIKNNYHADGLEGNYYDSRQFIIMIGYRFF